jgi:uncharacterized protein (TIGR02996 family)
MADSAELRGLLEHCARTHDDTPRLVLADWLEEHGDFRAEFVRAAVEFDRTPPYDFKRFQLGERLRALLATPSFKEWLPASTELKWGWRRGLLTLITDSYKLQTEDHAQAADWFASDWIERVEFDPHSTTMRPNWEGSFGLFRNVREASFGAGNYGAEALERLREWPHLRWLGLSDLWEAWAELAALPHLRALKLDRPDWEAMPELQNACLPNLEVLSVDKEWNGDLPHWGTCFPKLRSLTLEHYNGYPDEQCKRFVECPQLRSLEFRQRFEPFTHVGVKAFAKLKEFRSLSLGPLPQRTLSGLGKLPNIEHLATFSEVDRPIRGLEGLTQLRWLSLGVNVLTKGSVAQILKLPHLARLDLDLDTFEPGTIAALAKAPSLRTFIVTLRDEQTPLSEFERLEQLQYLQIGLRDLTQAETSSLQTALPACRIVNDWRTPDDENYDWS